MSRTDIRQKNVNLVSNNYKTQSSRILTQFEEYPRKHATLIKITFTTVRGQAKADLTIQRTSADMKTPILQITTQHLTCGKPIAARTVCQGEGGYNLD